MIGVVNSSVIVRLFRKDTVVQQWLWAMEQMQKYRLSRGIEMNDCLIASVCARLQIPIYTHNIKDMQKILPISLVIQPIN